MLPSSNDRHRADRWSRGKASATGERLYLGVGLALLETGLSGELERSPAQRAGVGLAAALAFGLLLAVGALAYRRAAKEAEIERVDAILDGDCRSLG